MPSFRLEPIPMPSAVRRKVYALEVDGKLPFKEFEKQAIKAGRKSDLTKIAALLTALSNGNDLPKNANKELRGVPTTDEWREFELRKNQTRVYYFLIPPDDKVVVLGEFKKDVRQQRKTIAQFREWKQAFKLSYEQRTNQSEEE